MSGGAWRIRWIEYLEKGEGVRGCPFHPFKNTQIPTPAPGGTEEISPGGGARGACGLPAGPAPSTGHG